MSKHKIDLAGKNNGSFFGMKMGILYGVLLIFAVLSFWVGRYALSPKIVIDILLSRLGLVTPYWEETLETVVLNVRLPRILLAMLVGGALSVSGASYQTLFKNPMVSPDILGVSAGAGFGAALAMIHNAMWWQIQLSALVFGLAAVLAASLIGYVFARQEVTVMVLGGVVVSSLFQALLSIVKTLADTENALPSITFWLMGSLGRGSNRDVMIMLPALLLSLLLLFLFRYQINALSAGEDEATTLGVNVMVVKVVVVISSTLMTVTSVSICGIIGWVGMVVPHISRMLVGANYPKLISTSFGVGALFLLIIDNIVRGVPGVELPLGVLTALVGTPIFVILLSRVRKGWM
ncbi:FecCD family ABC transporter permease [Lacrimispora sp.]|uniref:FecCD family ABC transporter permease n=1 Tax=Lacrimispora sp. TaxID=2719234 RepID=UPI002FDB2C12